MGVVLKMRNGKEIQCDCVKIDYASTTVFFRLFDEDGPGEMANRDETVLASDVEMIY